MTERKASVTRKTGETDVEVVVDLDGSGRGRIQSGIAFLDHMLMLFAKHGLFDLEVRCRGDLEVDGHHSVEDIGICLGTALDRALGDRQGLVRFAHAYCPMDEALARVVVDLSGRSFLVFKAEARREQVGGLDTELVEEFWKAVSTHGRFNLHVELLYGRNAHHIFEAVFKAAARAFNLATRTDPRVQGVPSTKGVI
ncbi:MAG: imidazoleglycerol-phosphate dehydratase HisB [Acidobacteria bacterium]|nr:imidazoleglycerol-phosphate dehydratase HisB [Acidobacteriota bacterium]